MMSSFYGIEGYQFSKSDGFLFDANIWIFMYAPQRARGRKARVYSRALGDILRAEADIYVDVVVLSEFINRYARLVHAVAKGSGAPPEFKVYRNSPAFKAVAKDIADASRRILKHCQRTESCFSSVDVDRVLREFETTCPDFNDQMLAEICKANGFKLVTDDSDFRGTGLTVLTANKKLLRV